MVHKLTKVYTQKTLDNTMLNVNLPFHTKTQNYWENIILGISMCYAKCYDVIKFSL